MDVLREISLDRLLGPCEDNLAVFSMSEEKRQLVGLDDVVDENAIANAFTEHGEWGRTAEKLTGIQAMELVKSAHEMVKTRNRTVPAVVLLLTDGRYDSFDEMYNATELAAVYENLSDELDKRLDELRKLGREKDERDDWTEAEMDKYEAQLKAIEDLRKKAHNDHKKAHDILWKSDKFTNGLDAAEKPPTELEKAVKEFGSYKGVHLYAIEMSKSEYMPGLGRLVEFKNILTGTDAKERVSAVTGRNYQREGCPPLPDDFATDNMHQMAAAFEDSIRGVSKIMKDVSAVKIDSKTGCEVDDNSWDSKQAELEKTVEDTLNALNRASKLAADETNRHQNAENRATVARIVDSLLGKLNDFVEIIRTPTNGNTAALWASTNDLLTQATKVMLNSTMDRLRDCKRWFNELTRCNLPGLRNQYDNLQKDRGHGCIEFFKKHCKESGYCVFNPNDLEVCQT